VPLLHRNFAGLVGICLLVFLSDVQANEDGDMMLISNGSYTPLFKEDGAAKEIKVSAFYLDKYQVTNKQFLNFAERDERWRKDQIKPVFSDKNYLKHISENVTAIAEQPVTNVSWFAARAYCKSLNKRLPSTSEWEYVGKASQSSPDGTDDPAYRQLILDWYSVPAAANLPAVKDTRANYWQVHGMHGVVWELINDFNTSLITGESRGDSQLENQLYCGAGAASSVDPSDYAAFMRYALRSSYEATYTMESMGFRCAKDATDQPNS
jgi:sulfatase modifying factor 1